MAGTGIKDMMGINKANFSTVEKDLRDITTRFLSNETLMKLLYFNTPDCLSNESYALTPDIMREVAQKNIRTIPSLEIPDNKSSFLIVTFDRFMPNQTNSEFMDNMVLIDVLCPVDAWTMESYMMRPFHIMHEVQNELDNKTLNGIGKVYFMGSDVLNLGEYVGYKMAFSVINDA